MNFSSLVLCASLFTLKAFVSVPYRVTDQKHVCSTEHNIFACGPRIMLNAYQNIQVGNNVYHMNVLKEHLQ